MEHKNCFNCNNSEEIIPLLKMSYKNKELWICPGCIPHLIHEPHIVQDSLKKAEK